MKLVKKRTYGDFEEVIPNWGICYWNKHWFVVLGDADENAVLGRYRNRRRAKKEITHYLKFGSNPNHFKSVKKGGE